MYVINSSINIKLLLSYIIRYHVVGLKQLWVDFGYFFNSYDTFFEYFYYLQMLYIIHEH